MVVLLNVNLGTKDENIYIREREGGLHRLQDLYFHSCYKLTSSQNYSDTHTHTHVGLKLYCGGLGHAVLRAEGGGLTWWYVYQGDQVTVLI